MALAFPCAASAEGFAPPVPPPEIQKQARVAISYIQGARFDAAEHAIRELAVLSRSVGIRNLTPVAASIITLVNAGAIDDSASMHRPLVESVIDLAPDYPGAWFLLARTRLGEGLDGFGPAFAAAFKGLSKLAHYPRVTAVYVANLLFYVQDVLVIIYIIGAFALLFRYASLFRHDFGDLFPRSASTHFTALDIRESRGGFRALFRVTSASVLTIIVFVLLVAPVVLGFGLLVTAALWMFIAFPYAGRSERAVSILATVVISTLPLAGSVVALPETFEKSPGSMRWSCINEYCPTEWLTTIQGSLASSGSVAGNPVAPDTYIAAAAGGLQWAGESPDAIRGVRQTMEGGAAAMASADGRVWHGNLLVLEALATCPEKRPDVSLLQDAVKSYETAGTLATPSEAVFRGLAVAHGLMRNTAPMEENLQKAVVASGGGDLDFMVHIKMATTASDACMRYREIASELRPPAGRDDFAVFLGGASIREAIAKSPPRVPFKGLLIGAIPFGMFPLVLGGIIVFGVILAFLLPASRRAIRCQTCGGVSCPSCNRMASGFNHCPTCLFDKVKPSFLDPEDVQIMLTRPGTGVARRVISVIMSIAVPGSGQVMSGKPVRGMAMLMLLGLGLEMVIFPEFPVVDSFAYIAPSSGGLPVLPPVLLILAWGWSVADVLISRVK